LRLVRRRIVVLKLLQQRILQGLARANVPGPISFRDLALTTPSWGKAANRDLKSWCEHTAVNNVAPPGEKPAQKARDFKDRVARPSEPVMHMAHALWVTSEEAAKRIRNWEQREPFTALLLNAPLWIWDAVEAAEEFRLRSPLQHFLPEFQPSSMVELVPPKIGEEMPSG